MALLRLVGLLHRVSWSSTVRPLGSRSFRPQEAHERTARTKAQGPSTPRDYRNATFRVSNDRPWRGGVAGPRCRHAGARRDTPREYGILGVRLPCGAGPGGATMRRLTAAGRPPPNAGRCRGPAPERLAQAAGRPSRCLSLGSWCRSLLPGTGNRVPPPGARPAHTGSLLDTRHIWRAALGELQVALSPANFETWLRHTSLVDVDDTRFRIAVPNGFAKDWLETRYRSLISQTLARIVGYSVAVEFVVRADAGLGEPGQTLPPRRRPTFGWSPRVSGATARRPTSTRATPS